MKTNYFKSALLVALFAGSLSSCVNDDNYAIPNVACIETTLTKTKEVADIPATAIVTQYTGDDVIEAYVTSSDKGGNFYKSISFQTLDGSKGFSVPVDVTSTYTNFEPGRKVLIKMKDLYTDSPTTGAIGVRIGGLYVDPATGAASVGRLTPFEYGKVLNKSCVSINENDLVQHVTINQAKSDNYINRLVEIDLVQFSDDAIATTYYDIGNSLGGATNHSLQDKDGNSIIFRTSSFATYAGNPVATGRGKVRGVITKYGSDYQFIARTENDIQLNGPRIETIFSESFTSNFPNWTKFSVTGAQVWTLDTQFGNPGSCAKMSGFSGGNQNNEDWLISQPINLTALSSATLTFETASKFAGNALQVFVSTDYSGTGTPVGSTWTELTGFTLDLNTGSYIWTPSGSVNLDAYAGSTIYLAYKYTSTTSGATTWEVDNIKIIGN